ncbi:putative ribonuclease H protein [Camellia lanceoleosa]|uniref:Ribonuclease H protein n=1 Tax=Camellia lanceoleosa TaxID=1840588 RepID=A0ACC0FC71_9ERIC|nr:putative ribonuclease H protein [Camellia lanceoleosa]
MEWNIRKLRALVGEEESQAISAIPISLAGQGDFLVWHYTKLGIYEVHSDYQLALEDHPFRGSSGASSLTQPPKHFWKLIWALPVPPKIRNFWWRVCCNKLATKDNLYRRRCATSPSCPICGAITETIEHLLFHCNRTRAVWFGSDLGFLSSIGVTSSARAWTVSLFENCTNDKERKDRVDKATVVGWFILKARNDWVFNHSPIEPAQVVRQAASLWREVYFHSVQEEVSPSTSTQSIQSHPS